MMPVFQAILSVSSQSFVEHSWISEGIVYRLKRIHVPFLFSDPKAIFREDGISKSLLEIMEGYMTTREKHLKGDNKQNIPGFSTSALVFDPKQFKANKEVHTKCALNHLV